MPATTDRNFKCIICGNDTHDVPFSQRSFKVIECRSCKFGIVDPIPSDDALNELYNSSEYFASHMQYDYSNIDKEEIERIISETGRSHEKFLKNYLKPGSTLLEIGTGGGFSLKYFERLGLNVTGVETSESSVNFARNQLGLTIIQKRFEDFEDDKTFDIIMLNHVMEHFVDVRHAMQLIIKKLNTGGLLYVRVPNHDSYDRRVYKDLWPAYLPFHISYFSRKSLKILFETHHLKVSQISEYVSDKFMASSRKPLRSIIKKIIYYLGMTRFINGRNITIIGIKHERGFSER